MKVLSVVLVLVLLVASVTGCDALNQPIGGGNPTVPPTTQVVKPTIVGSSISSSGSLIFSMSDGTSVDLGKVVGSVGPAGTNGAAGVAGATGPAGAAGKNGVGIKNLTISLEGFLLVTYTDDTSANLGKISGVPGPAGIAGKDGSNFTVVATANGFDITMKAVDIRSGAFKVTVVPTVLPVLVGASYGEAILDFFAKQAVVNTKWINRDGSVPDILYDTKWKVFSITFYTGLVTTVVGENKWSVSSFFTTAIPALGSKVYFEWVESPTGTTSVPGGI